MCTLSVGNPSFICKLINYLPVLFSNVFPSSDPAFACALWFSQMFGMSHHAGSCHLNPLIVIVWLETICRMQLCFLDVITRNLSLQFGNFGCISLLLPRLPKLSSQCYANGPGNLGNFRAAILKCSLILMLMDTQKSCIICRLLNYSLAPFTKISSCCHPAFGSIYIMFPDGESRPWHGKVET